MTRQAISRWPDELTDVQTERVLGAALRLRRPIPKALIQPRTIRTLSPQVATSD